MLIDLYLLRHNEQLGAERTLLIFHAGQAYAHAGPILYDLAVARPEKAFAERDPQTLSWNAYVAATIAFLKRDLSTLRERRDEVATGPDTPGNRLNLSVLDRLVRCFGNSYADAYAPGQCDNQPFTSSPGSRWSDGLFSSQRERITHAASDVRGRTRLSANVGLHAAIPRET